MAFDPNALKNNTANKPAPKNAKSVRLFLHVTSYETPDDGFHYAVGFDHNNPEQPIRVRLNTVDERIQDRPKADPEKIKAQYISGENTRDKLSDKKKADIKLLAFDDAVLINNADGVNEYRAHWSQTISTDPNAEIMTGVAHIRLREANENQRTAQAFVEVIKDAKIADKDIRKMLTEMVDTKDAQGRGRDPFAILRIRYQDQVYGTARLYPAMGTTTVFDQNLGGNKDVPVKLDGKSTLDAVMSGENLGNAGGYVNDQADVVRALVAGLEGAEVPVFNNPALRDRNTNLYHGAKGGQLVVEVLPCEKIEFGPDSRKTYLNDKFKVRRAQLQGYDLQQEQTDGRNISVKNGYTETVVGFQRHPDGTPYAVYASPVETFAKQLPLNELSTSMLAQPVAEPEPQAVKTSKKMKSVEASAENESPSL
ncbi:hypothetical protein [Citrobacter freundii]|uniref:hypothetical protein n=1 Tax=Citrobacter freundii TaxID=546 RepID=UPI0019030B92|nr:hypothetical protein [Citrobacter freundii]MBJ8931610.1 hypothetical protein [Citrobacter freundii]